VSSRKTRWNTGSYWTLIIVCAGASVAVLIALIARLAQILPNRSVPVTVPFDQVSTTLPVGPGGTEAAVSVAQGIIRVSGMPGITLGSLLLAAIVPAATAIALVAFFGTFCLNMSRGRVFVAANVRLALWTGGTLLAGWALTSLFTTMGVNGAFATLSDHSYDNIRFTVNYAPLFAAVAVFLIAGAFQTGMLLQRDTEGLI
jgi:hypothetical protein